MLFSENSLKYRFLHRIFSHRCSKAEGERADARAVQPDLKRGGDSIAGREHEVRREEPKLRLFAVRQRIGEGKMRDQADIIFRSADNRNLPDDRIRGHELPLGKLREAIIEEGGVVGPVVGISDRDGDEPPSVALRRADQNPARSSGIAGLYADRAGILP